MKDTTIATIPFVNGASHQEGLAVVRAVGDHVALCLSFRADGDIEVVVSRDIAVAIANALLAATRMSWFVRRHRGVPGMCTRSVCRLRR
jgi:hypothetical protein